MSTRTTVPLSSRRSKPGRSRDEAREYLVLKVAQGDLTVKVPAENAEVVGVRDVVGQEGLDRVFEVLRAPHTEEPTNWSRRYKANLEKLASGDVNKVAEVVRDLWRREKDRGLSAGEKRMLAKARQILVSELALAEGTDEGRAELLLDEVLATARPPELPCASRPRSRPMVVRVSVGCLARLAGCRWSCARCACVLDCRGCGVRRRRRARARGRGAPPRGLARRPAGRLRSGTPTDQRAARPRDVGTLRARARRARAR